MPTIDQRAVLSEDAQFNSHIPTSGFRPIKFLDAVDSSLRDLFVATSTSKLCQHATDIKNAARKTQFRILFLREDTPIEWIPEQLIRAGLASNKFSEKILLFKDWVVPKRVINAWADDSQTILIAVAFVDDATLKVKNCALETLEIPFSAPILNRISPDKRHNFEIDEAGSFIHWPDYDIDLDFDSLLALTSDKVNTNELVAEKQFGKTVKALRELANITQVELAAKTGISDRQIRRYEIEGMKPRVTTLTKLANAHNLSLSDYLDKIAQAISGPPALIAISPDIEQRQDTANNLKKSFSSLGDNALASVSRSPKSSVADIWRYEDQPISDSANDLLGTAIPIYTVQDYMDITAYCHSNRIEVDTTIGMGQWPSVGYIPADAGYFLNKITQIQASLESNSADSSG